MQNKIKKIRVDFFSIETLLQIFCHISSREKIVNLKTITKTLKNMKKLKTLSVKNSALKQTFLNWWKLNQNI